MEMAEKSEKSEEKEKEKEKKDQSRFGKMRRIWRRRKTERGCQVCFLPPASSDAPETASGSGKEKLLDEFCPVLVKALIEKNDFYSKDCNVHLGV